MSDQVSEPVLRIDKSEGIATLTLNRPRSMNALSIELLPLDGCEPFPEAELNATGDVEKTTW